MRVSMSGVASKVENYAVARELENDRPSKVFLRVCNKRFVHGIFCGVHHLEI
jgi:hypothetical protein